MVQRIDVRAIIFKEDEDMWVAQCLEFDIGAQAPDLETLERRLRAVLSAEAEESFRQSGRVFGGILPAPDYYHNLFETTSNKLLPDNSDPILSDGSEVRLNRALAA